MVKQVFNDEGVIYNNLKVLRKTEPRITPGGDRETRIDAECLVCGTVKNFAWHKVKQGRAKSCGCVAMGRRKDITGQRQGKLVAVAPTETKKKGYILWDLLCDCGNSHQLTVSQFTSGHTSSCGCMQYQGTPLELKGVRYNRLVGVERLGLNNSGQYIWKWSCDCGNFHEVAATSVIQGHSKSCGCYAKEVAGDASRIHGMTNTPEYGAWKMPFQDATIQTTRSIMITEAGVLTSVMIGTKWQKLDL